RHQVPRRPPPPPARRRRPVPAASDAPRGRRRCPRRSGWTGPAWLLPRPVGISEATVFTVPPLTSRARAARRLDTPKRAMLLVMRIYRPQEVSRMRLRSVVCLALAALLAGSSLPAGAQGPIRIGASLSLTGTYA